MQKKDYQKGNLIFEGKTKKLFEVLGRPDLLWVENKTDITAFDNPEYTKSFTTKSAYATNTTCRIFSLLKDAGLPVAFTEQVSPTEFIAPRLDMIGLEMVARRFAVGSYLDRNPNLGKPKGEQPHRFHSLCVEYFLKTSGGRFLVNGMPVVDDIQGLVKDKATGELKMSTLDDPWIENPDDKKPWELVNPKLPSWHNGYKLGKSIDQKFVVRDTKDIESMRKLTRRVFYVLERSWALQKMRLIDFKIEFGYDMWGNLMIGDVIDNDSWRIRLLDWTDYSKQSFRDGEDLSEVERKYGHVSRLSDLLDIPEQVIVIWRGSPTDSNLEDIYSDIQKELNGFIKFIDVVASGHKKPHKALGILNELEGKFLQGGFIVANVGRSNGLGPMLAAHTSWPVHSICTTFDEHPEDIFSSVNMPSSVPHTVTPYPKLAFMAALNHLSLSNPVAYMITQEAIEKMDTGY